MRSEMQTAHPGIESVNQLNERIQKRVVIYVKFFFLCLLVQSGKIIMSE